MSDPAHRIGDSLPAELAQEVDGLLAKLCDELADEQELARLGSLIVSEAEVRRFYLRYLAVHSTLTATAGHYAKIPFADELAPPASAPDCLHKRELRDCLSTARSGSRRTGWRAAAAVLLMAGIAAWAITKSPSTPQESLAGTSPGPRTARQAAVAMPRVAQISYASPEVRWRNPNDSFTLTSQVRAGQVLALDLGSVELTYRNGTTLLLTGPSQFILSDNGGSLRRGELKAHVTQAGHGFTIETPHGRIVDRGTEFGVVVDDFGVSEVNVIEGRVEAFPVGVAGPLANRIGLTKGRTLQWSGQAILSMDADGQGRQRLADFAPAAGGVAREPIVAEARLEPASLERRQWIALGDVHSGADGVRLTASRDASDRPYIITSQEFDPAKGPIAISCDIRMRRLEPGAQPAFSVLTRADKRRGKPATPWHDVLASCLRCSLRADLASGEGMLEAGAKYEHDREVSTISWRGFTCPQPEVVYRLVMQDDGLNVSFTAALADNPSVSKTVTCRSLFRGVHNFIAFEGFVGGQTEITNVRVVQYRRAEEGPAAWAGPSAQQSETADIEEDNVAPLLRRFIPSDAELVAADAFESPSVDVGAWLTLGDVSVVDGQLQLGASNSERHIDTWKPRPYLLTAKTFDPASRPLAIVGCVKFADNFLHGYGGSFAVLTRAEPRYGSGPGWEQSALRRGVRANFWPAALGQNRSLELFEMLSPAPINLLAATDLPINPAARSYLFCVTDDGTNAALTIIDPAAPEIRQTLSSSTESTLLTSGHVAFEGCWGAPVLLDNLRIYQQARKPEKQAVPR
ncbi:MAG: FecR domain-containing protein [Pirellulales bacterium]|nr:FecR domain-containing protein [Pirellulales bacterium]